MEISKSIEQYLSELASSAPTPGGGNVAAFAGVLASSLGEMVCNLTIGKKKYASVEAEMIESKEKFIAFKNEFVELGKKDNEAFEKVMEAFKLEKETDEQKALRQQKIDEATFEAGYIPSQVVKKSKELLTLLKSAAEKGNQNSLSDAGVGVSLCRTAAQGAYLNVLINYSTLANEKAKEILTESAGILEEIKSDADTITKEIYGRLG